MPYHIGHGNCVIETDTGKVVKCHDNHASALAHLRALEVNVVDAGVILMGEAAFVDDREERLIRFTNATLARVETNANNDVIEDDELDNLVSSLPGMPIDIEHDKTKNIGAITAARREGVEIKIDGFMWPHRVAEYQSDPEDILTGKYKLSIEADALAASCSVCGQTFKGEKDYCSHLRPENKLRSGAKRFFKKLRGMGAAITRKPAGTGAGFEMNSVYLVAHLLESSVTKSEGDGNHPASHYLVVEDPEKSSTWHLRVKNADGDVDQRLLGAAWAALHGGYRGNKYEGPDKASALSKLRSLYRQVGAEPPGNSTEGAIRMELTAEEFKAALAEALNPLVASLKETHEFLKANMATPPDEDEMHKEMEAAVEKMASDKDAEYQAKVAELEASLSEMSKTVDLQASNLSDTKAEMLRLKLVGSGVMPAATFEAQKGDLLNTPASVLESMLASFSTKRANSGPVWIQAGKIETPASQDYEYEV